tara:strand:- start:510 stop:743 length:234 start_codon:yes stop_codon:yes gene_type:complete
LPWIDETPTTSNVRVLLFGVKTTLKRLAVKLELSWQVLRDFDSINLTAEAPEKRERIERIEMKGESNIEDRMIASIC